MALLSASCEQQPATKASIEQLEQQLAAQNMRIIGLEAKVTDLESSVNNVRNVALSTAEAHESLRKTFNHNVILDNQAKVSRMTANGACGQETIYYQNGGYSIRNKECTLKDLR